VLVLPPLGILAVGGHSLGRHLLPLEQPSMEVATTKDVGVVAAEERQQWAEKGDVGALQAEAVVWANWADGQKIVVAGPWAVRAVTPAVG
jgi:hypothetical protein